MVALNFTLQPEALAALHDALVCLAKFSESVSIEARRDRLSLTALNSSKSAYASFVLDASKFFAYYKFSSNTEGRFTCRIYNKALLSVFKGRILDPRGKDTTVDRCEVSLQDKSDDAECRLIIKMLSNQGVTKTYKLTYESVEVMHALFDKHSAHNRWTIRSSALRDMIEYFGTKTEQLDVYAEDDRVTYTSYTEKVSNGKEILKHPLQTAVTLSTSDFETFEAAEKMHIVISVKDFKAIVTHADHLRAPVQAYYSEPARPLQFSYSSTDIGLVCEFTLMTHGDYQDHLNASAPASSSSNNNTSRAMATRSNSTGSRTQSTTTATGRTTMPPPAVPASRTSTHQRKRAPPGSAAHPSQHLQSQAYSEESDSLFMPQDADDDDARWDPAAEEEEEEETLGWGTSGGRDAYHPTFRDTAPRASGATTGTMAADSAAAAGSSQNELQPTQRLSQIHGLW